MTNEERQKLVAALRSDTGTFTLEMHYQAADELERLAKELAELRTTFRAAAIELGDPRTRQHPERQKRF